MSKYVALGLGVGLILGSFVEADAFTYKTCNGKGIGPLNPPWRISQNLFSIPSGSPQELALLYAFYELRRYAPAYDTIEPGPAGNIIRHGDGRFDVALVDRASIDGASGLTKKKLDGCNWWFSRENIKEADVMVAADLDFNIPDESVVITGSNPGKRLGIVVMVHEYGHSIGLEHSNEFSLMHAGVPVPFTGSEKGSGGSHVYYTGDDAAGIRFTFGSLARAGENLFASAQHLEKGLAVNNAPVSGVPKRVCPGGTVTFWVTEGNNGVSRQEFNDRISVSEDPWERRGHIGGFDLELGRTWVAPMATFSWQGTFPIPTTLPRGVTLFVYTSVDYDQKINEVKEYDNYVHNSLRIIVDPPSVCGR